MKSRSTYLCTKNKIGVKNNHNIPCMISGLEFFSTYTQPIEGAGRFMAWNFGIHFHFTVHQLLSLTAQSRINQSTKTSAFQTFTAAVDPQVSHSKWEKRPGSQVPIPTYMPWIMCLNSKEKGPWASPGSSNPKVIRRGFSLKNTLSMSESSDKAT